MHAHPGRLRAIVLPAVLVLGLFAAGPVSAADPATPAARPPTVAGTGVLMAQGDGHARLAGSYVLAGSLDGGTLRIEGAGVLSRIRVTGWTSRSRLADGTLVYRFDDAHGRFRIGGRTIVTSIESHSMRFGAAGHGRAWLVGTGTYWANGHGPFPWTAPGAESTATPSTDF
jgi:hypothetical protein